MELRDEIIDDIVFSLDIGTRTIIGIVGQYDENEKFKVLAYSIKEHSKRNMYDGQIHDIEGVANVVKEIVWELEEETGESLKKVSIAAAGRALKTQKIRIEHMVDRTKEISRLNIETLDLDAVQKAQEEINSIETNKNFRYYSIGYTVIDYYLDEDRIENLEGHKGQRIGVELLATFLPQIVIEGLYSVISRVGLEVGSITLEPIAAINIAIKKEFRLLNLVLVDIGAGTSDIAITKDGQITSYAMTQTAGDEITERLSQAYLLDFNSSEKLKVELSKKEKQEFKDIVGVSYKLSSSEIVDKIIDIIEKIASEITGEILKYNGKAPNAVFLIGGTSQMPLLKETIAEKLGLPKERVSIRDITSIDNIEGLNEVNGPDMITPIGIAIEGAQNKYRNFINLTFNGEEVKIFNTKNIKVSDILIMTNYKPKELIPKRSKDFIYYINDKKRIIKGREGTQPKILVDGKEGNLKTRVYDQSIITTVPSKVEIMDPPSIYDLISPDYHIDQILINGKRINENYILNQGDKISLIEEGLGKKEEIKNEKNIKLTINDEEMNILYTKDKFVFVDIFDHIDFDLTALQGRLNLKINGKDADYMEELQNGDIIRVYWE